jgi:hypothetical protein
MMVNQSPVLVFVKTEVILVIQYELGSERP